MSPLTVFRIQLDRLTNGAGTPPKERTDRRRKHIPAADADATAASGKDRIEAGYRRLQLLYE